MSYDLYMLNPASEQTTNTLNPTYNLSQIFDRALTGEDFPNPEVAEVGIVLLKTNTDRPRGLRILDGKTGAEAVPLLATALDRIDANWGEFKKLEPDNGWGSVGSAVYTLRTMLEESVANPTCTWSCG